MLRQLQNTIRFQLPIVSPIIDLIYILTIMISSFRNIDTFIDQTMNPVKTALHIMYTCINSK